MDVAYKAHSNPLNCLRCSLAMQSPVRLPCQHHFCRECAAVSSECMTCLKPFNLTELVIDKVLSYIIESSREATETCANCDRISQPMFFCETCQQPLCGECREITHKAKIFHLHNIVQMEERGRIRCRPFCTSHNEPFILYCLDSKSLMCIECFNSSSIERRGHFLNIDVAYKICCDKLEKSAINLRAFQTELREQYDLIRRLVDDLEKNFDFMSKEVGNKCDEIITLVNQLKNFLIDKLLAEKTEKRDELTSQLNNFDHMEYPLAVNLLSVSIFCSYASKIDLLHFYGDLSKFIQQFLSTNSQFLQKIKLDSSLNINFANEFNLMVCQPLGFVPPPSENNLLANKFVINSGTINTKNDDVLSNNVDITNTFDFSFVSDALITSKLSSNDSVNFNSLPMHSESDKFMEQRFMDHFKQITNPLQKFTEEISLISISLMDLLKDIVLRRCIVNREVLINRLSSCENAWDQLEVHKKKSQLIIQQLNQLWRKDLERVQRQQQLVREKIEEMQHLQKLAQQALKISHNLKPFAVQMADIISVIDVRRTTLTVLSPMEKICSEISQIGTNSESRVAAIDKEEKLRIKKLANTMASQALENNALQSLKNLKALPSSLKPTLNCSLPIHEKIDNSSSIDLKKVKPKICSFGQNDKDPSILVAREKLLESIKEKVKRID